jgi:hypothetical protein
MRMAKRRQSGYSMGMTHLERDILQALTELDAAVKSMAAANPKPDLRPLFQRLDTLALELPRTTHPDFRHYMNKKSYEKARLFLLGRQAENLEGSCRHV